jgi:hypothetical protein
MRFKPLNWQADPNAREFAKETQAVILKTGAKIALHQQDCAICKRELASFCCEVVHRFVSGHSAAAMMVSLGQFSYT